MRVCDTHEDVRSTHRVRCAQKNVRATGECVYTPVVHTAVATTCVRNPKNLSEKTLSREKKHSSLHDHLDKKNYSIRRLGSVSVCTEPLQKFSDFIVPCPS